VSEPSEMHRQDVDSIVSNGGRDPDGSARMLSRWTFGYTPAREIVQEYLSGRVLNACAGRTKLNHEGEIVRNDLNPEIDADPSSRLWCPDCWKEHQREKHTEENHQLAAFSEGGDSA